MYPQSLSDLFSLENRVALVTGASGDLGRAMAHGLAVAGAHVAVVGRSERKLTQTQQQIQELGREAEIFSADLSSQEALRPLVRAVLERFGRIDILLNCAGTNYRQPFLEFDEAAYDEIMATNMRSVYFLSQLVAKQMIAQGGGKIIHIGSLTSAIGLSHVSAYGMTKGALVQLTKTMAVELAEHNIYVNCICPGFFATELTVPLWGDSHRKEWMLDRLPIKRPGKSEDLIGLAVYLASDASNYTTGQSIYVDGGFLAGSQW